MYAITFDLSVSALEEHYGIPYNKAYSEIRQFLESHGFSRKQGSVYFGDDDINAVKTVMVVAKMHKALPWLKNCITDIRMLRIEENNDLMPAFDD